MAGERVNHLIRAGANLDDLEPSALGIVESSVVRLSPWLPDLRRTVQESVRGHIWGSRTQKPNPGTNARGLVAEGDVVQAGSGVRGVQSPAMRQTGSAVTERKSRKPDLATSRKRIQLLGQLTYEFATIKDACARYQTPQSLQRDYPNFLLWKLLGDEEIQELPQVEFRPRAYATTLVCRREGIERRTLKYDRRKLRKSQESVS